MVSGGRHLALVGLSGTGKSTVAPVLARRLGWRAVDLDRQVEAATGATVTEIFTARGEEAFRELETAALREVLDGPPAVVATGGGVVLSEANRVALGRSARTVWLHLDPEGIVERLEGTDEERPLLTGDALAALRRLTAEREALYRSVAEVVIDVAGLDAEQVADAIEMELSRT